MLGNVFTLNELNQLLQFALVVPISSLGLFWIYVFYIIGRQIKKEDTIDSTKIINDCMSFGNK
jgi:hypothetical protein